MSAKVRSRHIYYAEAKAGPTVQRLFTSLYPSNLWLQSSNLWLQSSNLWLQLHHDILHIFILRLTITMPSSNSTSNSGQGSGQGSSSTDRDTHYIDRADKNIRDFESKFTPKGGSGSGSSGSK
ncbi:hypothetical protein V2G26_005286 [Clonostachys chloroleuca]